jgi:hypothetical protein
MPQPQNHHAYVSPFKVEWRLSDELVAAYGVANLDGSMSGNHFTLSEAKEFYAVLGEAISTAKLAAELAL